MIRGTPAAAVVTLLLATSALHACSSTEADEEPKTTHTEVTTPAMTEADVEEPGLGAEPAIPGLAAVDIYGNLEDEGFSCRGPDQQRTTVIWTCRLQEPDGSAEYEATATGGDATSIVLVEGMAYMYARPTAEAVNFLGFLATIPYDGADPAAARAWVQQNINAGESTTTIGTASFRLYGSARVRVLEITGN